MELTRLALISHVHESCVQATVTSLLVDIAPGARQTADNQSISFYASPIVLNAFESLAITYVLLRRAKHCFG